MSGGAEEEASEHPQLRAVHQPTESGDIPSAAQPQIFSWLDLLNLVPGVSPTPLRATEQGGRRKKEKRLYFGGKSLVPDDYVPPKKLHPILFGGCVRGRQLNIRNFHRHVAIYSPTEFNENCVDMLETLGAYKKPGWYSPLLASAAPVLVEHQINWQRVEHEDGEGGVVAVDWAHPSGEHDGLLTPTVIIVPGLAGHSGKDYVRSVTAALTKNLGYRVCVLNWRCSLLTLSEFLRSTLPVRMDLVGRSALALVRENAIPLPCLLPFLRGFNAPLVSERVFRPHDIADTELCIEAAVQRFPASPMYLIGFSAGSNQVVKYLGKHGDRHRILAAMSVCNGFEYGGHLKRLEEDPLGAAVYSRGMTYIHQEYLREHGAEIVKRCPDFDLDAALNATKHSELDAIMVRQMYGFDSMDEYYAAVCCRPYIPKVRVPLLCLQSRDDPLFTPSGHTCCETLPVDELHDNKNIIYFESEFGSHLNFVEAEARNGLFARESHTFCDRTAEAFFDWVHQQDGCRRLFL